MTADSMSRPVAMATPRLFALELDVLRGIAAVLMIANHAGFRLLSSGDVSTGVSGAAVFLGSFAPVVFFFTTGFGIALAGDKGAASPLAPTCWKALLLVIADQFFYWRSGVAWGIDFFSFIAIATLVVTLVARLRRPGAVAAGLVIALVGLRYGLGPSLRVYDHGVMGMLRWLAGARGVENISYPLAPWMVFPLLGLLLGRLYKASNVQSDDGRRVWLIRGATVAGVLTGMTLLMVWFGATFFRWGTVSAAYFVLSLGVLAAAGSLAIFMSAHWPRPAHRVALRGVASFAVIPLHYAMLDLYSALFPVPVDPWVYALLALVIVGLSIAMASRFAELTASFWSATEARWLYPGLLALLFVLAIMVALGLGRSWVPVELLVLAGQLSVAVLLGTRPGALRRGLRRPVAQGR